MFQDHKDLLSAFQSHGVRYLIVGGYAVIYHAQPRFTKDIDLFIQADPANSKAVYDALAEFGAPLQGTSPEEFVERGTFFRFGNDPQTIDIIAELPGVDFNSAWDRRVEVTIDENLGIKAYFIGREDLIASKLAAGRPQDLADADAIKKAGDARTE
jgi:predicted nucleotidyltransferase